MSFLAVWHECSATLVPFPGTLSWLSYSQMCHTRPDTPASRKCTRSTGSVQSSKTTTTLLPIHWVDYNQMLYLYWKSSLRMKNRDNTTTSPKFQSLMLLLFYSLRVFLTSSAGFSLKFMELTAVKWNRGKLRETKTVHK